MQAEIIPLFPLGVVLFPEMELPLYIFEDRYKEMIAHCIAHRQPFGVLYMDGGKISSTGTTAVIEEILDTLPDGRMRIRTKGIERFRVIRFLKDKPYLQAEIEFFEEQTELVDSEQVQELMVLFREYLELRNEMSSDGPVGMQIDKIEVDDDFDPDDNVSFKILSHLSIELPRKQMFLEMDSEVQRITLLQRILKENTIALRRMRRIRRLIGNNGHAPPFGEEKDYFKDTDLFS